MITGNATRKVASYLPIDHAGKGVRYVKPGEGVEFIGHPYQMHTDNSAPFIELVKDGRVTHTINALDLAEIEFADEEPVNP